MWGRVLLSSVFPTVIRLKWKSTIRITKISKHSYQMRVSHRSTLYSSVFNFKSKILNRLRRRQWHPTPVLLPEKSHGWRSLVGCSLWGREESDMTERLPFHFSLSCIGEGNGNPLQCSCLENPRDGGAWWAVVYGVAQSRTRLKQQKQQQQGMHLDIKIK